MVKRGLAVVVLLLSLAGATPTAARAADRADEWRAQASWALTIFDEADTGNERTSAYGLAYEASGRLRGWNDARTVALLNKILLQKKPDGGYGLNFAFDVLSDGTVNPASTTYTVTLADHVGSSLLEGYRNGAVPRGEIQNIVNLLMSTPRIDTAAGQCIAYSRHPNDTVPYACVHNVSAGAARFLMEANAAGVGRSGLAALVEGVTRREVAAFDAAARNWHYADTRLMSDPDHTSYQAWSMYTLAPQLGTNIAYSMINTDYRASEGLQPSSVIHARLTALPASSTLGPRDWCAMGDQWISEVEEYVKPGMGAASASQIAQLAAKAADACEVS